MNNVFLLQLDGVSGPVLSAAMNDNLMPFTKSLMEKGWVKRDFFCGLPSTTPASQINLMYGLNDLIPGFSFYIKSKKKVITPFHPETLLIAEDVALKRKPDSLLKDGVTIFTLFTGGAKTSISMSGMAKDKKNIWYASKFFANPVRVFGFFLKILVYLIIERKEHKTVRGDHSSSLARVFFVVKRMVEEIIDGELAFYFSKQMIREGKPVIYVDFTGYDEIAHDYSPFGKFSMYYLSLLDMYIKGCYKAIQKSKKPYEFIVFSDHGQTPNVSYNEISHETFEASIVRLYPDCKLETKKTDLDFLKQSNEDLVIKDTGNMFLLYDAKRGGKLTKAEFEKQYPDFFGKMSALPGIECVVGRGEHGGVVIAKGKEYQLNDSSVSAFLPTLDEKTKKLVIEHLQVLLDAEFGADVYVIGSITKDYCVGLTKTPGIHGGIGGDQTTAFIVSNKIELPKDIYDFSDIYRSIHRFMNAD